MEASLAATGMLDVLATKAVLFMMLSVFPPTSMVSCWPDNTVRTPIKVLSGCNSASSATHLGEVSQYFWHLVTTLPTAYVDDDVAVGVLRQGLRDDSLSTAKGTRDGCGSSLHTSSHREERRVQENCFWGKHSQHVFEDVRLTEKGRPGLSVQSAAGDWRAASPWRVALVWRATPAPWWTCPSPPQTPAPSPRPDTERHTHAINTKHLLHSGSWRRGGLTLTSYCPGGAT